MSFDILYKINTGAKGLEIALLRLLSKTEKFDSSCTYKFGIYRVKTRIRSTMVHDRLESLLVMMIERKILLYMPTLKQNKIE